MLIPEPEQAKPVFSAVVLEGGSGGRGGLLTLVLCEVSQ